MCLKHAWHCEAVSPGVWMEEFLMLCSAADDMVEGVGGEREVELDETGRLPRRGLSFLFQSRECLIRLLTKEDSRVLPQEVLERERSYIRSKRVPLFVSTRRQSPLMIPSVPSMLTPVPRSSLNLSCQPSSSCEL